MKVSIEAVVSQRNRGPVSRGLQDLKNEATLRKHNVDLDTHVKVHPRHDEEDDDNGGGVPAAFEISQIVLSVGVGVLTTLAVEGILNVVKRTVKIVSDTISGNEKVIIDLKMPGRTYTLTKRDDRLAFKAQIEAEVPVEHQAEIEEHFREIGELLGKRYDR